MASPSGEPITPIHDSTRVPHLAANAPSLFPRLHARDGLVWTLETRDVDWADSWTMLSDFDRNGTIDACATLNFEQYAERYTDNPFDPGWLSNHVFDYSPPPGEAQDSHSDHSSGK